MQREDHGKSATLHAQGHSRPGASSVRLFPRRKACEGDKKSHEPPPRGRAPIELTLEAICGLFDRPQAQAAQALDISTTTMKQVCRKLNIVRWPFRRSKPRGVQQSAQPSKSSSVKRDLDHDASDSRMRAETSSSERAPSRLTSVRRLATWQDAEHSAAETEKESWSSCSTASRQGDPFNRYDATESHIAFLDRQIQEISTAPESFDFNVMQKPGPTVSLMHLHPREVEQHASRHGADASADDTDDHSLGDDLSWLAASISTPCTF